MFSTSPNKSTSESFICLIKAYNSPSTNHYRVGTFTVAKFKHTCTISTSMLCV